MELMRVFEFHFNPELRPDLIFDSFCYEPENIYEKKMGNLYLTGLLKNVLPQNLHFLDKLAKVVQKEYYRSTARKPEKALKEGLREANEFLEQIAKKGDVSWLGNLSFAVLSLKNYELNFTKVGDLKIFLLRGGETIDIDRKLKFGDLQPWPLKVFGNIVSGKLIEDDVLLASTKEVTDFFEKENLLPEIGRIWPPDQKGLREIFDKRKEEILKISGISLFIVLTKEVLPGKIQVISEKSYPKEFNLREAFSPLFIFLKKIKLPTLSRPKLSDIFKRPEIKLPKFPKPGKKIILTLALVFFLILGFLISQLQEERKLRECRIALNEIQEKVNRAEGFLFLENPQTKKEANLLLKESWEKISQLSKIVSNLPRDFQNQVFSLRDEVSKNLLGMSKLETIEEPELLFDFSRQDFIPQKMIFFKDGVYFFSPYSHNLFELNKNGEGKLIEKDGESNLAASSDDSVLFLSKPNQISIFKNGEIFEFSLKEPYADFDFDSFSVFRGNLYFLDKNSGEIIVYPYLKDFEWSTPQLWLDREEKKATDARSLAVDGSIWLLTPYQKNSEGGISRYHAGRLQEKIILEIFPESKEFKKIFTSPTLPYLYILESVQKRMVILDKKGQIVKQFQSEKFDNLLDFAVSEDGKTIYFLNNLRVYKVLF